MQFTYIHTFEVNHDIMEVKSPASFIVIGFRETNE